jgi:hypothetical protein
MSQPDNYEVQSATGSGATVRVDFAWEFSDVSELEVYQQNTSTGDAKTAADGVTFVQLEDVTGTYVLVDNYYGSGTEIEAFVARRTATVQEYTASNGQALNPAKLTAAFDVIMRIIQEIVNRAGSGIEYAITSIQPFVIASKSTRRNKVLAFTDSGEPTYLTYGDQVINADAIVFLSNYTDLAAAITAIGSSEAELWVDKNIQLTANITIPANITLRPVSGSIITGPATITFESSLAAGNVQIFDPITLTVAFGRIQGPINPVWFGAKGDGITDDTTAFQAAIDALPDAASTIDDLISQPESSGNVIEIPTGTYSLTTIFIYAYTTLMGQGRATELIVSGGIRWQRRVSNGFDGVWHVKFKNFMIRGAAGTETLFAGSAYTGTADRDNDQIHASLWSGIYFSNAGIGIKWSGGYNSKIENSQAHRCDIAFLMGPAWRVATPYGNPQAFCDDNIFINVEVNNCRIGAILTHAYGNKFIGCPWAWQEERNWIICDRTKNNAIIGGRSETSGKTGITFYGGQIVIHNGTHYRCIANTAGIADAVTEPGSGSSWTDYWSTTNIFYTTPRTWQSSTSYFSSNAVANKLDGVLLFTGPQASHDASGSAFYGDIDTHLVELNGDQATRIIDCPEGTGSGDHGIQVKSNSDGATLMRNYDAAAISIERRSLHAVNYQWTASGSGTNEYYLEANGGGNPSVDEPIALYKDAMPLFFNRVVLTPASAGSLAVDQWDYADNDSLGYNTVYVRLASGNSPDTDYPDKADGQANKSAIYGDYSISLGTFHEQTQEFGSNYMALRNARFELNSDPHFSSVKLSGSTNDIEIIESTAGEDRITHRTYLGQISLRSAAYQWTASGSGTNEYYLEAAGGGNPFLKFAPLYYLENGNIITSVGTLGSLSAGEGGYGDNDALGYNTAYIRLTDNTDPDTKALAYVSGVFNHEIQRMYQASGTMQLPTNTFIATLSAGTLTRIPRENITSEAIVIVTPRNAAAAALTGVYAFPWSNEEIRITHSTAAGTEQFNVLLI